MGSPIILTTPEALKAMLKELLDEYFGLHDLPTMVKQQPSTKGEEQYYDRDEVCRLAHVSYTTLWRMEKNGVIEKHKVRRRNLYLRKEVDLKPHIRSQLRGLFSIPIINLNHGIDLKYMELLI